MSTDTPTSPLDALNGDPYQRALRSTQLADTIEAARAAVAEALLDQMAATLERIEAAPQPDPADAACLAEYVRALEEMRRSDLIGAE